MVATKIYGSCTGNSGSKYNLWIEVTENSQSVSNNTSNVTAVLKVKRNDGYDSSAYNLTAAENNAKLYVGGTKRVDADLAIDTRNCATVTLASWTGNVSHASDGTLKLTVSGSFSMSNTGLTGGSVSGNYNCTAIPRASTLASLTGAVNPGGSFSVSITSASNNFTHKIKYSIDSYNTTVSLAAGALTNSFTVPQEWARGVLNSDKGTITVTLYTYNGAVKIGTKTYSKTLAIPDTDTYKPDFDITVSQGNTEPVSTWGVYVKGIGTVNVNISSLSLKYGAAIASKVATVCGIKKTALPASFTLTSSGQVSVTVKVSDSRGLYRQKSVTLTVLDYAPPSLTITDVYRCLSDGTRDNNGTYFAAAFSENHSPVGDNNVKSVTVSFKTFKGTWSLPVPAATSPVVFGDGNILISQSYDIKMCISDSITTEPKTVYRSVSSSYIPFNIRSGGKGAAFGKYAENEDVLESDWVINARKGLSFDGSNGIISLLQNNGYLNLGGVKLSWGYVDITPTANTPTLGIVNFPTYTENGESKSVFSSAPMTVVSPSTEVPGTSVLGVSVSGTSKTGLNIYLTRTNSTVTRINWFAVGI